MGSLASRLRCAALLAAALGLASAAHGAPNPVVFSALGDVPYGEAELVDLQTHVDALSLYSPSAFLIHLGDIQSATESCRESRYQAVAEVLKSSEVPVFILPGDNEWVDCANPDQGFAWWTQYLLGLEQNFCGIWPVNAQSARPENFSFVRDGVLFIGLNYVAGVPSAVAQADVDWVNAQFAAYGASSRAAVLLAQKEPSGALFDAIVARGRAFAKPVLYLHGDGHAWLEDPAFFGEPNLLRVQVERGTLAHPPVEVTVASNGSFLFDRDPWPAGTAPIPRGACTGPALSIDDVFATEGGNAVFTVSLAGATGATVTLSYATQGGTATSGQDFSARSGTLTFSGTTTQLQLSVPVAQDTSAEEAETFTVNLSDASGATLAKAQGSAVIIDDDSGGSGSGTPVRREVASGGSVNASSVTTSAPLTGAAGDLYLAAVAFKPNVAVSSVSGLGLAWTPVRTQCAGRAQTGVALFRAQGTPTGSGPVTATLGAVASAAVIEVAHYAGASASGALGSVVSANTNGVSGGCANGIDGATYAFPLTTGAPNSLVFVAAAMRSRNHLPGTGFSEIAETFAGSSGSAAGESLAERLVASATSLSVNGGFDATVDWAVVAAEVRASGSTGGGTSPVTLSVTTSGSGSVALSPSGGSYAPGTSVTLTATPAAGWAFGGWSGGLSGSANPATLVVNANTTVNASFLPLYTVTVTPTTGGSVSLSPSGGSYPSGTLLSVTALPQAGYVFTGWSGALTGTRNPESLLVDSNETLAASFAPAYSVSVSTTGNGSVSLSPSGGSYPSGTLVTLTALPGSGASFLGWGGALSGTQNPTTLLVDANQAVSAAFSASYTLSVSTKGKGSVTLSPPGGSYSSGTQVTLTAVPGSGFVFSGWSGDVTGTANPATVVMDRSKSALATFRKR